MGIETNKDAGIKWSHKILKEIHGRNEDVGLKRRRL